jgi:Ger(x)C family germination protein
MFSDNDKISARQFKRLMILDIFSTVSVVVPGLAATVGKQDGLLITAAGMAALILYGYILGTFIKNMEGSYLTVIENAFGKIVKYLIGFLYLLKFILNCSLALRLAGEIFYKLLLPESGRSSIVIPLLIVCIYGAWKGIEGRARVIEILFYIAFIPIIVFFIYNLKSMKAAYLFPLYTVGLAEIAKKGYLIFIWTSAVELSLFSAKYLRDKKRAVNGLRKSTLCVGILTVLLFAGLTVIYGVEGMIYQSLNNMGMAFILLWFLALFSAVSGYLFYMEDILKDLFHYKKNKTRLAVFFVLGAVSFWIANSFKEVDGMIYIYEQYMKYFGMPVTILALLFIWLFRKKKGRAVVASLLVCFLLSGCGNGYELEDRSFVMAVGIDSAGDQLKVSFAFPDMSEITGQDSKEKDSLLYETEVPNLFLAEEEYEKRSNKKIHFGHLKSIVIGNNLAKEPEKIKEILEYILKESQYPKQIPVFISQEEAVSILELDSKVNGSIGTYLSDMIMKNDKTEKGEVLNLSSLINQMEKKNSILFVPVVAADENERPAIVGTGAFLENCLQMEFTEEEASYIQIAAGEGIGSDVILDKQKILRISEAEVQYEFIEQEEGNILIKLKIEGKAESKGEKLEQENLKTTEGEMNRKIEQEISRLWQSAKEERSIDLVNSVNILGVENKELWKKYAAYENIVDKMKLELESDIKLEETM